MPRVASDYFSPYNFTLAIEKQNVLVLFVT